MKNTHIVGLILIALAIGAIFTTVSNSSTYVNFSDAMKHPNKEFHVVGTLNKEKGTDYNPEENANIFSFYLVDKQGTEKKVLFNGTEPQDFEKSEQIVLIGKMKGEEFIASKILMKCPSKYNNGKPEEMQEYPAKSV